MGHRTSRPKFLLFHVVSEKKWSNSRLTSPLVNPVSAPVNLCIGESGKMLPGFLVIRTLTAREDADKYATMSLLIFLEIALKCGNFGTTVCRTDVLLQWSSVRFHDDTC